jgi:hypothetical protein
MPAPRVVADECTKSVRAGLRRIEPLRVPGPGVAFVLLPHLGRVLRHRDLGVSLFHPVFKQRLGIRAVSLVTR